METTADDHTPASQGHVGEDDTQHQPQASEASGQVEVPDGGLDTAHTATALDDPDPAATLGISRSTGISVKTSRAALARTPRSMLAENTDVHDVTANDHDVTTDDHDVMSREPTQNVLITELQDDEPVQRDVAGDVTGDEDDVQYDDYNGIEDIDDSLNNSQGHESHGQLRRVELLLVDDLRDEDYDTDLDTGGDEEEDFVISYYKTVCEELGLVPVKYFLHRIKEPVIRMRYRGLGTDATKAIALALKESVTLDRLDLCGNWIGDEGAKYMSRLLEENDYITDVTLSENKIGSEGGADLAHMLSFNGGLRRLDLSGNEFDDKCAENFAQAIENNKYLRELNLSRNKFSDVGAQLLAQAIGSNENLDILDLSWNHFRESGGVAIAKGLKENVRLKVCNLSWNGLGPAGGLEVAEALAVNQTLLEVDISGNRLGQEVAIKMAKVLTTNDTLRILKMGNNLITSSGALALASAINNTQSCELEELDLTDVPVEYEFLRTMEDVKYRRPDFRVKHGPIMRSGNTVQDISSPAIDVDRIKKQPVVLLKEHIVINDMRLLDIFKRYDTDDSMSISPEDFIAALEELAVPYDKKRLEESIKTFTTNSTGKIFFGKPNDNTRTSTESPT
ncbi:leucine-rich repeat-containing protein 74B-like isoform X2 [Physella acuta]|uniref:leucine-rich repeat-containing protein 74B-like isoform X1 n=1 Tax=Physella acuta TaxID=109671 RepID=UPI0027DDBC37|nr:leucine-rich repeat-containing protein 74B-like isoform X1 [Physella acuta]XP_059162743.1 leucine-rich repeat-containing protein 74B-like isoform X2 [Physella acuta]